MATKQKAEAEAKAKDDGKPAAEGTLSITDSRTGEAIVDLLAELHAMGRTIVLITHDREVAARAPRRVTLRDGREIPVPDEAAARALLAK